ncbi:MAG: von Willebrand factor type A domain-containing protein [Bacteroidota bacterium]
MKKMFFAIVFLGNTLLFAQTGSVKIKITEKSTMEEIPFANISIEQKGRKIAVGTSNILGECMFDSLNVGIYTIKVNYVGYQTSQITRVKVENGQTNFLEIKMEGTTATLQSVEIITYSMPLIDPDTKSGSTVTREEYQNMASKSINSVAATSAGIYQSDESPVLNVRGSRASATAYYIDGVKVSGYGSNSEEYQSIKENEFKKINNNPFSTFSIDVDAASYSNVRRFINDGHLPPKNAVRIEEMINYFSYDYPKPKASQPFSITSEVSECPWNTAHQLIHIGLKGKKIETENLAPTNLVFLIDVSGSMDSPDKLPLLKSALTLLVEQLREQDKVSIVVYAGAAGLILSPTRGSKKDKIFEALNKLSAGGSTAGGEGIVLAYKMAKENFIKSGNNRVILATDGDFNVGVSSDDELSSLIEEKRNDGIFLTVLGFGTGNYKDSKMEQLADKGNGNYAYIDNVLEAKKVLVKEMGATLYTIAKDVKIQIEFNPSKIKAYRLIGYENRVLADEDFNNDKKDAGEIGSGHSVTAVYEIIPSSSNEVIDNIDSLKYQKLINNSTSHGNELMTIKFRYKEPNDTTSKLIVETLLDKQLPFEAISNNFKFATAVIEFGLLLKDSKYKGTSNYKEVIAMAKVAKGEDEDGYRAEFVRLAETCEIFSKELTKK